MTSNEPMKKKVYGDASIMVIQSINPQSKTVSYRVIHFPGVEVEVKKWREP
jgi:hypothetical protein